MEKRNLLHKLDKLTKWKERKNYFREIFKVYTIMKQTTKIGFKVSQFINFYFLTNIHMEIK